MSDKSAIEWTDATWNPVRGCTKISPGCRFCYAETFAERWRGIPGHPYEQGFDTRTVPTSLEIPLKWKKPRRIFVNSMSDLFHKDIPDDYIAQVFDVMVRASQHTFQVLTKRSERLAEMAPRLPWPRNVWAGVSVESQKYADERIPHLLRVPAAVRFLSIEPLLAPVRIDMLAMEHNGIPGAINPLTGWWWPAVGDEAEEERNKEDLRTKLHWVIVGGESGHGARPLDPAWVTSLRDQCEDGGVPFFFKQWGGTKKKEAGRLIDGRTYDAFPEVECFF